MSNHQITSKRLILVLALFLSLGIMYSVTVPIFEAPDEVFHYFVIHHIKEHGNLPNMNQREDYHWEQEGSQPPMYYLLGATLISTVDTSDAEDLLWLNPQRNLGDPGKPGNKNFLVHTESEQWPYQGTTLAVHMLRWLSLLFATGSIAVTYQIGRVLFPDRPLLWLGASAIQAFIPQFIFISSSVNNDNLNTLLASLVLLQLLLIWKSQTPWRWIKWVLLGLILGVAILTKLSSLALVALTAVVATRLAFKQRNYRQPLISFAIAIGLLTLISGWWFARNWQLYSDLTGLAPHIVTMGERDLSVFSLSSIRGELVGLFNSFWGLFGWFSILMPDWTYIALATISVLAMLAAFYRVQWSKVESSGAWIMLLWLGLICASLVRWTLMVEGSQGRLLFPTLPVIVLGVTYGVIRLGDSVPRRVGGKTLLIRSKIGQAMISLVVILLFFIAAITPFNWIKPAYTPSPAPTEHELSTIVHRTETNLGQTLQLIGVSEVPEIVHPNDVIEVTTYWDVLRQPDRNWSIFVHLHDPVINAAVAQRDMYLGQGLVPSTALKKGQLIKNRFVLQVPETVYSPADLELRIGVYDHNTWERMTTSTGEDSVLVAPVTLAPSVSSGILNPVHVNFGNKIALAGYGIEPRRCQPGDTVTLELHWQALAEMTADYTVFAHIRDSDLASQKLYGQHDVAFSKPTSSWSPGESAKTVHQMIVADDAPPEVMSIEVGLYRRTESGGFERLRRVRTDGQITDDYMILTPIRVDY